MTPELKGGAAQCSDLNEDDHLAVHFADLNGDGLEDVGNPCILHHEDVLIQDVVYLGRP